MYWFRKCLTKYADFEGRARRKEYWMFVLGSFLIQLVTAVIVGMLYAMTESPFVLFLAYIPGLAMLVPSLAVSVRRMHDLDKSGWMIFVSLIPIVGGIWYLVLTVSEGTQGENSYGPDPKEEDMDY